MRSDISYTDIGLGEIMYQEGILYYQDIDSQPFHLSPESLCDHQGCSYLVLIESFWIRYVSFYPTSSFESFGIFIEISERESNYSIIAISRSEEHIVDNYIFIIRIIYICQLKRSSSNCRIPAKVCGYLDISGKSRVRIRPITAMMSFLVRSISPSCMYSTTLWNRFSSRLYSTKKSSNRLFWNIFHRGESSKSTA